MYLPLQAALFLVHLSTAFWNPVVLAWRASLVIFSKVFLVLMNTLKFLFFSGSIHQFMFNTGFTEYYCSDLEDSCFPFLSFLSLSENIIHSLVIYNSFLGILTALSLYILFLCKQIKNSFLYLLQLSDFNFLGFDYYAYLCKYALN